MKVYQINDISTDFLKSVLPKTSVYCKLNDGRIIEFYGISHFNVRGWAYYNVRFLETNGEVICNLYELRQHSVRDPNQRRPDGGYLGATQKVLTELCNRDPIVYRKVYTMFHNMMQRCYAPKCPGYKSYGAKGVRVSEDLHSFYDFYNYIVNHPDFNAKKMAAGELVLDKDLTQLHIPVGQRIYSKDTIRLISDELNRSMVEPNPNCHVRMVEWTKEHRTKFMMVTFPDGHKELAYGEYKFCDYAHEKYNYILYRGNIANCLIGKLPKYKNFYFRYLTEEETKLVNKHLTFIKENIYKSVIQLDKGLVKVDGRVLISRNK